MPEEKADFLRGAVFYYTDHPDQQIRLITDSSYALTGELQDEMHTTCLYSANPNLVKLLKEALANEIKLVAIQNE